MTIPRFGRITPLQGDMLELAGHVLSRQREADGTDEERMAAIEAGHAALVRRVGHDLGYDVRAWHERLLSDNAWREQYQHPYAWRGVREAVQRAFADPDRERLVTALLARARN
jgi:hypothetical protein